MQNPEELQFRHTVDGALKKLMLQVDQLDTDDIDARLTEGVFVVEFESGGTFVLSQQVPLRELWLSAFSRAWHFSLRAEGWRERDTNEALESVLASIFSRKLGRPVSFRA